MNKLSVMVLTILLGGSIAACSNSTTQKTQQTDIHTSQQSLDWSGKYVGLLPCADCGGIETSITLNENNTYEIVEVYQTELENNRFAEKGTFAWENGSVITLKSKDTQRKYKVGENKLIALDMQGKEVQGKLAPNYILTKENN